MKNIILAGGGTAGHIQPIMAIAEVLNSNHRVKYLYIGSRQGLEKEIVAKNNVPFRGIIAGKRRTYFSISNFWDIIKTFLGIVQVFFIYLFFKPKAVFSKGGYVTFPIVFWAYLFKIPLIVHESDTVIGRANRWAIKFAKKICVGFPVEFYKNLTVEKLVYTGTPVKKEFFSNLPVKHEERPIILITGGSQGSSKINQLIIEISPSLLEKYELFHICGTNDYQELLKNSVAENPYYHLMPFTNNMAKIMRDADLVISRAGASTLAEISALGKASILIPLPTAHMDHQTKNAKAYEEKSAAVVVSEKSLTRDSLLSIIESLMGDDKLRQLLGHHSQQFIRKDAAQEIVDIIFEQLK